MVVGDVYVDYALENRIVRLGGVFHSARALHAFRVPCALTAVAPTYLHGSVERFSTKLGIIDVCVVGTVNGAPNVMLVRHAEEAGDQGYDDVLRGDRVVEWNSQAFLEQLNRFRPTDLLVVSGDYPIGEALESARGLPLRRHCDTQYLADVPSLVRAAGTAFETVFVSTSSPIFRQTADGDPRRLREQLNIALAKDLVLKENRGGSRVFMADGRIADAPSFPARTAHSIGVGDCFDCAWIASSDLSDPSTRLARASYMASLYASTWSHDRFVENAHAAVSMDAHIADMAGVRTPWESRPNHPIYLAAPDFPDVDTAALDELEDALRYHNFSPRRPVKEFGLYNEKMSATEARMLYSRDCDLLSGVSLLIAVPLMADPGTFTELGIAHALGIPTIIWNRGGNMRNMFAAQTADRVCRTLSEVIDAAFALVKSPT